jgi:hypothetical protein
MIWKTMKKKTIGNNNGIKKKPAPELAKKKNNSPIKNNTPIAGFFCLFIKYPPYELMTDERDQYSKFTFTTFSHEHILSYKNKKSGFPRKIFVYSDTATSNE